jgi:DNA-binding MarR family transcriptional regulator
VIDFSDTLAADLQELWGLIFQIVADVEKRLAALMSAHDLTPPQFYVLKTLTERGGSCPIGEIARDHHLTNATMTGLVKRLESMPMPLVRRERSQADRRSITVLLTGEGAARYATVQADMLMQVSAMVALLDEGGLRDLIHYARKYIEEVVVRFPVSPAADHAVAEAMLEEALD